MRDEKRGNASHLIKRCETRRGDAIARSMRIGARNGKKMRVIRFGAGGQRRQI